MGIGVAVESMRPDFAIHADAGDFAVCVAESFVELERAGLRIEVQHEQAVLAVFAGVGDDAMAVLIGGEPVRLLFVI